MLVAGARSQLKPADVGFVDEAANLIKGLPVNAGDAAAQRLRDNAELVADARRELKEAITDVEEDGCEEDDDEEEDGDALLRMPLLCKPIMLTLDSLVNLLQLAAQHAELAGAGLNEKVSVELER